MTFERADIVVQIWGKYLEFAHGKVQLIFGNSIPESFLPFPKDVLLDALTIMSKHYEKIGNTRAVDVLKNTISLLLFYKEDDKSIVENIKLYKDENFRKTNLKIFKEFQLDWIKTQNVPGN